MQTMHETLLQQFDDYNSHFWTNTLSEIYSTVYTDIAIFVS